jgi:threonine dehydrogenase-like Zn-dependent dehydrogenase
MRAVVFDGAELRFDPDRPEPVPGAGEVVVRVLQAGICETDLQLVAGYKGFRGVLGHEFVGVPLTGHLAGRRVVGEINCACGRCDTCRANLPGHCPDRTVLGIVNHDGAFADLVAVPERNLHAVPDSVSTDAAVFTEPLAAAFQIAAQVPLEGGMRIIVLGDGRLGHLCAQVLARRVARLTVVGKHPAKLAVLDALGVETCLLADRPQSRSADVVVECTGSASGLPLALALVRPRGTVVLKTTIAGEQTLSLAPVVVDEMTIVGSRCGPFDQALEALAAGQVHVQPLISERFDLSEGVTAMARAAEPDVLKVLLQVDAASP